MKKILAAIMIVVTSYAFADGLPSPDKRVVTLSPDQVMAIMMEQKRVQQELQDALAQRDYWYLQYKKRTAKDGVCI